MMTNPKNLDINDLEKQYKNLYAIIDDDYHRIDINERIKEYNDLTDIVVPTDTELTRIHDIQEILERWIHRNDIDKLRNIYVSLKGQGINVKSPDCFLIGPHR